MGFGLGFIFRSEDRGLSRRFRDTEAGLGRIASGLSRLGKESDRNSFGRFIDGLQLRKLDQIGDALDRLANNSGVGNLSNGLDSLAATANRDVRKALVGLNVTGQQLKKTMRDAVGISRALNVAPEQVTEAAVAFTRAFGPNGATAAGFKSLKDGVRVFEAFGLEAKSYIETAKTLQNVTGLSAAGTKELAGEIFNIGKFFGVGKEALTSFTNEGGKVAEMLQSVGITAPDAVKTAMKSIAKLGGVIASGTDSSDPMAAFQTAQGVFQKIQESASSWQSAFASGQSPSDFVEQLSLFMGAQAPELAKRAVSDPAMLIEGMVAQLNSLKGVNTEIAKAQRKNLLTFATKELGFNLETAAVALAKYNAEFKGGAANLEKVAKDTLASNRTIDEVLQMMQESFDSRMKGILRRDGTISRFVKHQARAYKIVGDTASKLAADDGPLGDVTRALLRVNTFGLKGLLLGASDTTTALGGLAAGFLEVATDAIPAVTAMGAMGFRFHHLLFPVKAVLSPLAAVNSLLGGLPSKALGLAKIPALIGLGIAGLGAFGPGGMSGVGDYLSKQLPVDILRAVTGFDDKTFKAKFGKSVADMLGGGEAWTVIGQGVSSSLAKAWAWVSENFTKGTELLGSMSSAALSMANGWMDELAKVDYTALFKRVFGSVGNAISSQDEGTLGALASKFGDALKKALSLSWKIFSGAAEAVADGLAKWWSNMPGGTLDKLKSIWESHGATIGKALVAGMFLSSGVRALAFAGARSLLGSAVGLMTSPAGLAVGGVALAGYGAYKAHEALSRDPTSEANSRLLGAAPTDLYAPMRGLMSMGGFEAKTQLEDSRHQGAMGRISVMDAQASLIGQENAARLAGIATQREMTAVVGRSWRILGKSSQTLSDVQKKSLTPTMERLHVAGKLSEESWTKFVTEGKLDLRGKELAAFGNAVQADTRFLANEDRKLAQELELKLAGVKAEEAYKRAQGELRIATAAAGKSSVEARIAEAMGGRKAYDEFSQQFQASSRFRDLQRDQGVRVGGVRSRFEATTKVINDGSMGLLGVHGGEVGKAAHEAWLRAGGYSGGGDAKRAAFMAAQEKAQAIESKINAEVSHEMAVAMNDAAQAAGVRLPAEIRELISKGLMPLESELVDIRKKWSDHEDKLIAMQTQANKEVEAANLAMARVALDAREKEALAILESSQKRTAVEAYGQFASMVAASGLSPSQKREALDDAMRQVYNAYSSSGSDPFQKSTELQRKYGIIAKEPATSDGGGMSGGDSSTPADGGTTGYLFDLERGSRIGAPGETTVASADGFSMRDVVMALKSEGDKTRRTIAASGPTINVNGGGTVSTARFA